MKRTVLAALAALVTTGGAQAYDLGDPEKGEKVFRKCKACHMVGEGAKNRTGPLLNGIVGHASGAVEDYKYSKAAAEAAEEGLVWTPEELDAYLADPKGFMKGTKMSFRGLRKDDERADVIAYLATYDKDGGEQDPATALAGTMGTALAAAAEATEAAQEAVEDAGEAVADAAEKGADMAEEVAEVVEVAMGDPASGEKVFRKCKACHMVGEGAKNRTGPLLNGIVGHASGAVEDYKYSKAAKEAAEEGLVWNIAELDAYLADPKGYMKGTKMSFRGLKKGDERADVIAYLAGYAEDGSEQDPATAIAAAN